MHYFSEQQIVDCSISNGNYGCSGGSLRNTLRYLDKVGGLMAYSDYPYIAKVRYLLIIIYAFKQTTLNMYVLATKVPLRQA